MGKLGESLRVEIFFLQVGQECQAAVMAQARLAQSVEHETLNLRVVGSSPTLGA